MTTYKDIPDLTALADAGSVTDDSVMEISISGVSYKITKAQLLGLVNLALGDLTNVDLSTAPTDKQVLTWDDDAQAWVAGTTEGVGTVTSVALTLPAEFAVAGSPVTGSGTLAGTWANVGAGKVLAGPSSGADAAPSFRALAADDLPASGVSADTYGDATHVPQVTVDAAGRVTDVSEVAISGGGSGGGITGVNEQTGTTYTLVADDATKAVRCTNSSAITLTIPKHADVALPLYCVIPIFQGGDGAVTIAGDTGVTVEAPNGSATTDVGDFRTLFQRDTDDWVIG